jgi:hypothetical protein
MLAAYNAGPGRYDEHLSRGRPLPAETIAYLARLGSVTGTYSAIEVAVVTPPDRFAWRRSALFVSMSAATSDAGAARPENEIAASDKPISAPEVGNLSPPSPPTATPIDRIFVPRAGAGRPQ